MGGYVRGALAGMAAVLLSGCGIAPMVTALGYTADGISYLGSGKSVADHAISAANAEDCAMFRIVQGDAPCRADVSEFSEKASALAMISDGTAQPAARGDDDGRSHDLLQSAAGAAAGWAISTSADVAAPDDGGDPAAPSAVLVAASGAPAGR